MDLINHHTNNATEILKTVDALMEKALHDVIINLTNRKYDKETIVRTLSWGEKHTDIYFPLMKKHQPEFYCEGFGESPIQSFLILDFIDNNFQHKLNQENYDYIKKNK